MYMDDFHADGAVAGFLCYPLDSFNDFEGEERTKRIFDFRDKLEAALTEDAGAEFLTLTGGATGVYCGYVDFIAWDLAAVLHRAKMFFEDIGMSWASFHVFRRDAGTVSLYQQESEETEELQAQATMGYLGYECTYFPAP